MIYLNRQKNKMIDWLDDIEVYNFVMEKPENKVVHSLLRVL